jgi:dCTP deaminase
MSDPMATSAAAQRPSPEDLQSRLGDKPRILSSQHLRAAIVEGWVTGGAYAMDATLIQPASLDLRLGEVAWPLECSFLPDSNSTVEEKVRDIRFEGSEIDLGRGTGGILEKDRPYLIPLKEQLRLPPGVQAKANPKSSTGRLDVFTRVITDRNHRFDHIRDGYEGRLYLEVVPRSFAIRVKANLSLNQLRIMIGDPRLADQDLYVLHQEYPLLYMDSHAISEADLSVADGLFLSASIKNGAHPSETTAGLRAKRTSQPIDLSSRGNNWRDYWEPVYADGKGLVLVPETFYLLMSAEGVCIPPTYAAEMMAYDPTAGELRTHYAGFFDPGFGYDPEGGRPGTRAALEVRARDVPFMVEHRQPICKLAFEDLGAEPDLLYGGATLGSHYQGQESMLSKHFAANVPLPPEPEPAPPQPSLLGDEPI